MSIKNVLLKIAGKDNMNLDEHISFSYLGRICFKYGFMMLKGYIISVPYKGISSKLFVGHRVKLIERKNMLIGCKTKLHDFVKIDALSTHGVQIGKNCVLGENTRIECTGSLSYVGYGVKIGDNTSFGNDCFFGAAGGIDIGDNVIAGQYVRFHSENHLYNKMDEIIKNQGVTHKGIKVGNNCWIGSGAVFLDGSSIGDGCVVAANAVVSKNFPDNCVVGGVPAKLLKTRGES